MIAAVEREKTCRFSEKSALASGANEEKKIDTSAANVARREVINCIRALIGV